MTKNDAPTLFSQSNTSFEEINQIIWKHLEERDWTSNPPRGLATSIALEASELLEHFQWTDTPVGSKEELAAELADIFIYAFQFAQKMEIDVAEAITAKLKKSAEKYPAEAFKGKDYAERRKAWNASKVNYRKEGL